MTRVVENVDAVTVVTEFEREAEFLDARSHDVGATHEQRPCNPSSTAVCAARSTRSSLPSAYITRFGARLAAAKTGSIGVPNW
jgi:hypothetical protein